MTIEVGAVTELVRKGGRVDWSRDNEIAVDLVGSDGFFDIWRMSPQGQLGFCANADLQGVPTKHVGQPAYSPDCEWLIFQAEKQVHPPILFGGQASDPGGGVFNDLYILGRDGLAYQLTDGPNQPGNGVLHPHFSRDGRMVSWAENYEGARITEPSGLLGSWRICLADFFVASDGVPSLQNIRRFQPGDAVFYESHGFTPDGSGLLFASNMMVTNPVLSATDIWILKWETGELKRMTDSGYNEHAQFSPDGNYITWMSNRGQTNRGTDYWIMNLDGTGQRRLTFFNVHGHPHRKNLPLGPAIASDHAWNPDGTAIAAKLAFGIAVLGTERTYRLDIVGTP